MARIFYTEKEIEDLVKSGVKSLEITEGVALTVLAYEKAQKLGLELVHNHPEEVPGAPVRPYLSQVPRSQPAASPNPAPAIPVPPAPAVKPVTAEAAELQNRIRSAVIARLGPELDAVLLDSIISRVLTSTGLK